MNKASFRIITRSSLNLAERKQIMELWNNEYPESLRYHSLQEFEDYLSNLTDQFHILILSEEGQILGWYFDFIRENERWFAAIIDSSIQGKGFGADLIGKAMEKRILLNGWVIDSKDYLKSNGQSYESPLGFYRKMGFTVKSDIRLNTEKISAVKIQWAKD